MSDLKSRIFVFLGATAVLAALGGWFTSSRPDESLLPADSNASRALAPADNAAERAAANVDNDKVVEIDVMGNRLDASRLFDLGFAGGLNIDQQTRATLDTLLMNMSDTPAVQEIEKLEWTLRNGLPKDDADKAIKMFHGYRAYLGDMKGELQQMGIPDTPAVANAYFDQLALLQRRHFDEATAAALFGQENLNARLVMQAALISQNEALSESDKQQQLEQLRTQLPPDQRGLIPLAQAAKP